MTVLARPLSRSNKLDEFAAHRLDGSVLASERKGPFRVPYIRVENGTMTNQLLSF